MNELNGVNALDLNLHLPVSTFSHTFTLVFSLNFPTLSSGSAPRPAAPVDPWGAPPSVPPMKSSDPWAPNSTPASDPWGSAAARSKTSNTGNFDLFSASNGDGGIASSLPSQVSLASSGSLDLFDPLPTSASSSITTNPTRKTPESFLGPNAALVNLDSLVTKPAQPAPVVNPFLASTGGSAPAPGPHANPFQVSQPAPPTLNQMRVSPMPSGFGGMAEPISLSTMPAQPITMVPLAGMAPMGHVVPGMGVGAVGGMGTSTGMSAGIPASMSMPQPLMSMPPHAGTQPAGTTNPFLL